MVDRGEVRTPGRPRQRPPEARAAAAGALMLAAAMTAPDAGRAAVRYVSYTPADAATQAAAGDLTFGLRQRLVFTTVVDVRSTDGPGTAVLRPVGDAALGPGGLARVVGRTSAEKELYEIESADQGPEMIRAFCPGSAHAWLAFGKISMTEPLRIQVIGDDPAARRPRLCRTLAFNFHGEWRLPPGRGVPFRDLMVPSHGPLTP